MLGGAGWTREEVTKILGESFYVMPCGAVPKNGDPFGKVIPEFAGDGINSIERYFIYVYARYS